MKFSTRQRLLASTLLIGAASMATPAWAQTEPVQPPAEETPSGPVEAQEPSVDAAGEPVEADEAIIVTGSRIARPNVESASPVTVVSSEAIDQAGTTRIEDLVNSLPQVTPGQTAFVSNG